MKGLYQRISESLRGIIRKEYGRELEPPLWELPSKKEFGDLSSMAALKLASVIKEEPLKIATKLKISLEKPIGKDIDKIEILKPGFINIFISRSLLIESLNELIKNKEKFWQQNLKKKVLLEFLSANPTGPLSIAHGRQAVVGDVIGNILEFFGNQVTREYYINDEGRQIDLLIISVEQRIKEIKGEELFIPEEGYQAGYVKDIAKDALETKPKNLREFVLSQILALIKKDLASLGIEFDSWFSQKKLIEEKNVEKAIATLQKKGMIYEKEGALWFSSTKFGDDKDRVVKKNDGELTYFASDIAYHWDKIKRGFNVLINLWGPDHHGYIERVKAAMKAGGFKRDALKVIIIQLVSIKTKERMSRRKGTAILLSDLVKELGGDTVRFYYLTRKNSSHLEFDIDLALEASFNNPFYYIQYACARIESVFEKAKVKEFDIKFNKFINDEEEIELLRTLMQFSYCLEKAYYTLESVFIIEYLKTLAAQFHQFYERKRVLDQDENITGARLNLLEATRIVLHCALHLLGIEPLKKM